MNNTKTTNEEQEVESKITITQATKGVESDTSATNTVNALKIEVDYLKYFMIVLVIVVAVGFILNLFDIFHYRYSYFQKYNERLEEIEKQNIILETKMKYETRIQLEIENLKDDIENLEEKNPI